MNTRVLLCLACAFAVAARAQTPAPAGQVANRADAGAPISLPAPDQSGGRSLMAVLKERQSIREFNPRPLPLQVLSDLLWAAWGINRPAIDHRTAPSTMNMQEIDLYVARADGLFLYEAKAHELRPVLSGDLRKQTGGKRELQEAPAVLIMVADHSRMSKAKPQDRDFYAAIDTGFISQNVYLYCASARLATVVHELERAPLSRAMKLRPEQRIVIAQSVGYPK
jgi:nitroreductase